MERIDCIIIGESSIIVDNSSDTCSHCSFFVSNPVTLEKVKSTFPYEGTFHFRVKLPGNYFGFQGNVEYIWLDLNDNKEVIPYQGEFIELQALILSAPESKYDYSSDKQKSQEYIDEISDEIPIERPSSKITSKSIGSNASNSMGKVFSNIKKAAPLKNINLNTVKSGATNIWKAVVATASSLQQSVNQQAESQISSTVIFDNLNDLESKTSSTFDDSNAYHTMLLKDLFNILFPSETYERESLTWKQAGFQKPDPILDLKTSGILSLYCMLNLGKMNNNKTIQMVNENKTNTKSNYPFAIVGVNLSLLLIEVFHIRDKKYMNTATNFWDLFNDSKAFFEIFNIFFIHIDNLWRHRNAVRAEFGKIIGEVKALLILILKRGPKSIDDFKMIATDEGIAIIS